MILSHIVIRSEKLYFEEYKSRTLEKDWILYY